MNKNSNHNKDLKRARDGENLAILLWWMDLGVYIWNK